MKDNKLEVGDIIYAIDRSSITDKFTVERVTKTQAICNKNTKFRIEPWESGRVKVIGETGWSITSYYLENDNLRQRFKKESLIRRMSKIDWSKVSNELMEQVESILTTPNNDKQ